MAHRTGFTCPLCSSPISRGLYERVLRITEARREAETRAAQKANRAVQKRLAEAESRLRTEAARAAAKERARLEAVLARERRASAERERVVRREAMTTAAAARRDVEAPLRNTINTLKQELQLLGERRRRDEENWKRVVEELRHRVELRDQAHFGPDGEDELEKVLRSRFPGDRVQRTGRKGDVLHLVTDTGRVCGRIVYECKRTKTFSVEYVRQLKKAMEAQETEYGLLVTRALPRGRPAVFSVRGVLVATPAVAAEVASILRESIVAVARLRLSDGERADVTAELLSYVRGEAFANAMIRIEDRIKELRTAVERERSHHDTWWRTREQHYATILREAGGVDARVKEILARPARPLRRAAG